MSTNWENIMQNFYNSEDYHLIFKFKYKDTSEEAQKIVRAAEQKYNELLEYPIEE